MGDEGGATRKTGEQLSLIGLAPTTSGTPRALRPPRRDEAVVSVLPEQAGIDKVFDYRVPAGEPRPPVGSVVAVSLGARKVRGWVLAVREVTEPATDVLELAELDRVVGAGPPPEVIDLCRWVAHEWVARLSTVLRTASPDRVIPLGSGAVHPPERSAPSERPAAMDPWLAEFEDLLSTVPVITLAAPPLFSLAAILQIVSRRGPMIVVTPSVRRSRSAHRALTQLEVPAALLDEDWGACRHRTAVGQRSAVFAPLQRLGAIVIIDEHDERLTEEGSPTWNAREVGIERARRAGVPCVLISPVPSVDAVHAGRLMRPPRGPEREGWPHIKVVETGELDPRDRQFPPGLIQALRGNGRVAVVAARLGQARVSVCTGCRSIAECERCGAALNRPSTGVLHCPRCDLERPVICAHCGRTKFKNLLLGVDRIAEELPAALGEGVGLVTAAHRGELPPDRVLVGTEALLHRLSRCAAVAFVDFDSMLLAPRYRAHEQALGSVAHAARLLGREGALVLCTRNPAHPLVRAVVERRPTEVLAGDSAVRESLRFPPFGSMARIGGSAGPAFVAEIPPTSPLTVHETPNDWLVRSDRRETLARVLGSIERPKGRLRLQVDPFDL